MVEVVKTHARAETAGDKQTWVNLFADDIVIEDPVGSGAIYRGIAEVSGTFWSAAQRAKPQVQLTDEVIVCGNEAVAMLAAEIDLDGARVKIAPIVAIFSFDAAGKVSQLRSFFNYAGL
jgi:steroid Delta-isomerase